LMGRERVGLSPEQEAICDAMVSIPMVGRCPSHHVSVATGIVLYEILNQRHAGGAPPGNT
jgi:TrmH family RNA methyltransferase